ILRHPRLANQRPAVKSATSDPPPRPITPKHVAIMLALSVCAVVLLVPIGLAVAIGVSWMAYSRQGGPQASTPRGPGPAPYSIAPITGFEELIANNPLQRALVPQSQDGVPMFIGVRWQGTDVEQALLGRWLVVSQETSGAAVPEGERLRWLQFGNEGD